MSLYLKSSSIYNKIMQLAIAIILIVVLLNLWLFTYTQNKQSIENNFYFVGQQYVEQATASLAIVMSESKSQLNQVINRISNVDSIAHVHVYDVTGQLIGSSEQSKSIKDLYGLNPVTTNKSEKLVPFVGEIRTGELLGYVRVTLNKPVITDDMFKSSKEQYDLIRLMLILSVIVGFLLTRGLSRFSRQGYRVSNSAHYTK